MGFTVSQEMQNIKSVWVPLCTSMSGGNVPLYVGQIVKDDSLALNGFYPVGAASGNGDATGKQHIFGVVTGTNNYPMTEIFNGSFGQCIFPATNQASQLAIMKMGAEGMHPKGDPQALVQVSVINKSTILTGDIYNGSVGVPPTLLTVTTGSTNGESFTSNPCDFNPNGAPNNSTTYCRTGANAGIYRVNSDTSSTNCTFMTAFPYTISVGDTFVRVPYVQGYTIYANFGDDILAFYWDCSLLNTVNYFNINVYEMDLRYPGKETVTFSFDSISEYPV